VTPNWAARGALRVVRRTRARNLPAHLPSLVGRDEDIAEVRRRVMEADRGLVTLTGGAGVGKTCLALAVADGLSEIFPDGAWLVELASLTDAALVDWAVASSFGIRELPDRTILDSLLEWLGPREGLLVLDNCEHLVEACAELANTLLAGCPDIRILATSREPLRIPGEATWRVASLAVPDRNRTHSVAEISRYPAVQLFAERARAVRPEFGITPRNAAAVAEICARLDGIPLALELAAARARVLSPEQILTRLDDAFAFLTGGSRTAPSRQQTLRATLDWGHDLLARPERILFRRLAVFSGGFDLEPAESVCADAEDGRQRAVLASLPSSMVLDTLTRLVDVSLVQADERHGRVRYRLLEPLRQYALHRLDESGEVDVGRERHLCWAIALAERAEQELWGPEQQMWLDQLETEHDNLRAGLEWCVAREPEAGLRVAGALSLFWLVRGYLSEGRRWLEALLAGAPQRTALRAKALHAAGQLARHQAAIATAIARCEESLAIYRDLGDTQGSASVLRTIGLLVWDGGDPRRGRTLFEESLGLSRANGDRLEIARTLATTGCLALVGADRARARACLDESLALYRELGDRRSIAVALGNLGHLAFDEGEYAVAERLLEDKLEMSRTIGNKRDIAYTLAWIGNLNRAQGGYRRAKDFLIESLRLHREIGDGLGVAYCLCFCGVLAGHQGEHAVGVMLMGAASSLHTPLDVQLTPRERADRDAVLAAARAAEGEGAFSTAWAEGQAMKVEQAVELALSLAAEAAPREAPTRAIQADRLTRREREVAVLIARGLTNRQLAERLVISERTADNHVANILAKLGFSTRAQVAVWAAKQQLLADAATPRT
jgi:predicted ATPase/DNA-binding NarL/FixJ family response regulator